MKRYLGIAGNLLSALAIWFVVRRLLEEGGQIGIPLDGPLVALIAALTIGYVIACTLTGLAWREAFCHVGGHLDVRTALHVFGVSQLAKYVPGNIFHLVGRQVRGLELGLPGGLLARSMAWELALQAVAGAMFLFLSWPLPGVPASIGGWVTGGAAVGVLLALLVLRGERRLARAVGMNLVFLGLGGGIFAVLLDAAPAGASAWTQPLAVVIGSFVAGWLAGFLTPGSPAGIGIREWVVLYLLAGAFPEQQLLIAVIGARIVSVLGDLAWFVLARWGLSPRRNGLADPG